MDYDNKNLERELLEGEPLTDQEISVLRYTAKGMTAIEIGERMHLSHETVKDYKKHVIYKLAARNSCHAVALGIGIGIVNVDEFVEIE
jgi:DNA-binding CsgD family transcriptional regulator